MYSIILTVIVGVYLLYKFVMLFNDGNKKTTKELEKELAELQKNHNTLRGLYENSISHSNSAIKLRPNNRTTKQVDNIEDL